MQRNAIGPLNLLFLVALSGVAGCQTTTSYLLSSIGLKKKPLAVALVLEQRPGEVVAALNPFARYKKLQEALADDLGRPVAVDPCFTFQARHGLGNGWYALAVVTPTQFARWPRDASFRVLAVPLDSKGRLVRGAVLIVPANSELREVSALRGQVVAFGPRDDARTHHAAVQLLRGVGVEKADLTLEMLPVPGSLKHMPDARATAQAVLKGSAAAGFIDEAAWEAFAEHEEKEGEPARDKLRVIGRTGALPGRLVIASPKLDEAAAKKVQAALLAMGENHPEALEPLGVSGYQRPSEELIAACRELIAVEAARTPKGRGL
ncbi:MAG: PhnD/SsuA/transferrin family substrate-binding protein [Phycisphaerae bacterium]|nr:PhnD/SsuA/transferrin family substrate-binding protein [Phycisphaerae bacterium]